MLSAAFKTCYPLETMDDVYSLVQWAQGPFANMAMVRAWGARHILIRPPYPPPEPGLACPGGSYCVRGSSHCPLRWSSQTHSEEPPSGSPPSTL
jgi:hypothetical protein